MLKFVLASTIASTVIALAAASAPAAVIISEVHSSGSSNATYSADFFELTNTGNTAVDITGWKVDDDSNAFATALSLRLITSIPAGASVVFMETNTSGSNNDTKIQAFKDAWFGANVPANFLIGTYGGSGIGLSGTADQVNIFNASGTPVTSVSFAAATVGTSFDNAAGLTGPISALSIIGTNGAFLSTTGNETGSPGTIGSTPAIPEPSALALLTPALPLLSRRRRA